MLLLKLEFSRDVYEYRDALDGFVVVRTLPPKMMSASEREPSRLKLVVRLNVVFLSSAALLSIEVVLDVDVVAVVVETVAGMTDDGTYDDAADDVVDDDDLFNILSS